MKILRLACALRRIVAKILLDVFSEQLEPPEPV